MANKEQRKVNQRIRKLNQSLANDAFLGLNRFSLRQVFKGKGCGEVMYYQFEIKDNVTGKTELSNFETEFWVVNLNTLFWWINDFIVDVRLKEKW